MAKEVKAPKVDPVEEVVEVQNSDNITFNLDKDPNDPRLKGDTPALPSLDD